MKVRSLALLLQVLTSLKALLSLHFNIITIITKANTTSPIIATSTPIITTSTTVTTTITTTTSLLRLVYSRQGLVLQLGGLARC